MDIIAQPLWLSDLSDAEKHSLSNSQQRATAGSDEVRVSPTYEDVDDDDMVDQIEDILSRYDLTPKLREIEDTNREKIGPRSIAKNWTNRREDVVSYFNHEEPSSTIQTFANLHGNQSLRPLSWSEAAQYLISSTYAGLPTLTTKGSRKPYDIEEIRDELARYPAVLCTRTQEGNKTRTVWCTPISMVLAEMRYQRPYLQVIEKELAWRAALKGPDEVDIAVTKMFKEAESNRDLEFISVDFSAFDASVTPESITEAFAHIASYFQSNGGVDLEDILSEFIYVGMMTPEGEFTGAHGVPSGSAFTNTVDSLVQWQAAGSLIEGMQYQIQGDDGLYLLNSSIKGELYESFAARNLKVNLDKSYESFEDTTYLQRYYHDSYLSYDQRGVLGGVYSLFRAYNRIKYQEKWVKFDEEGISGADYYTLRTLSILENCKHHPAFEEFAKLVQTHDKYNLQYSRGADLHYSKYVDPKARANLAPQKEDGFASLAVVKLLLG